MATADMVGVELPKPAYLIAIAAGGDARLGADVEKIIASLATR